ncbi:MAG: hypothetical protein ACXWBP_00160 [Limisphaerales bacterium]
MNPTTITSLGLLVLGCSFQGCTSDLWEQKVCKSSDIPLQLYRAGDDVMVQYIEERERDSHTWRRNFLLNANAAALAAHRPPQFFDATKEQMAEPIPLSFHRRPTPSICRFTRRANWRTATHSFSSATGNVQARMACPFTTIHAP